MLVRLSSEEVRRDFVAYLAARGAFSDSASESASRSAKQSNDIEDLWRSGLVSATELADAGAEFHALPRAGFAALAESEPLFRDLSRRFLKEAHVFPIRQ
jgi:general secretion pathway protein E